MSAPPGNLIHPSETHLEKMIAMRAETHFDHHERLPEHFSEYAIRSQIEADLRECIQAPRFFRRRAFALGWEADGDLRGYLLYRLRAGVEYSPASERTVTRYWITDIAVDKAYRRRGIGSALLQALREQVGDDADGMLYANVWAGNDASAEMFRRAGFQMVMQDFSLKLGAGDNGA